MEDSGIMGVVKSGGVIGSMIKGVTDQYKNNKALDSLNTSIVPINDVAS